MEILRTPADITAWREACAGRSVGFVPTMGALHAGHALLMQRARAENDVVVLSIYVNPTQFNDPADFEKYPATWEADVALAQRTCVDAIFAPVAQSMYPDDYKYKVIETDFSRELCGAHRPGHFDGVLTVVMKLFQLVKPTRAYFGEKDFQQLTLIRGMVRAFFLDLEIVPVPTVREPDGLALSSRNARMTAEERALAPQFHCILITARSTKEAIAQLAAQGWKVDYVIDRDGRRYAAIHVGATRLIDNVEI